MAIFYDEAKKKVRTTHFGASGHEDYIGHQDLQRKMNDQVAFQGSLIAMRLEGPRCFRVGRQGHRTGAEVVFQGVFIIESRL